MCFRPAAISNDKICPSCGHTCEPTDTQCPECGTALPESTMPMPGVAGIPAPGAPGAPSAPGIPAAPGAPSAPAAPGVANK